MASAPGEPVSGSPLSCTTILSADLSLVSFSLHSALFEVELLSEQALCWSAHRVLIDNQLSLEIVEACNNSLAA